MKLNLYISLSLSLSFSFKSFSLKFDLPYRKAMKLAVGFSLTLVGLLAMVNAEPEPKTYLVETGGTGR